MDSLVPRSPVALGCADPVKQIAESKVHDPQRQRLSNLFELWVACHGSDAVKLPELDQRVVRMIGGRNSQARASELQRMAGVRVHGFVFEIFRPAGRWGDQKYRVRRDDV